jgi:hypothetical protein
MLGFARIAATLFALAGAMVFGTPNLANAQSQQNGNNGNHGNGNNGNGNNGNGNIRGTPGPIAGAGLPFLAVGYGVYWLIKRRRKAE